MIQFTIPGEPQGKGRPRMTKKGHTYTPKETVLYENWIRTCYLNAGLKKIEGKVPIGASIVACYAVPKSASKKQRELMLKGEIAPMKKPDCDNVVKAVLDSLNGLAYDDDVQIVSLSFGKYYGEEPHVGVILQSDD